jgi:hypothetical protein
MHSVFLVKSGVTCTPLVARCDWTMRGSRADSVWGGCRLQLDSSSRLVVCGFLASCSSSRLLLGSTYGSSSWEVGFVSVNCTSYHLHVSCGAVTPWRNCSTARPQGQMDGTTTQWQNGGLTAQPLLGVGATRLWQMGGTATPWQNGG